MVTIKINKNGKTIRQFTCSVSMHQKYFDLAYDIAGGLWNGIDVFEIIIDKH